MRHYQIRLAMEQLAKLKSSEGLSIIDSHIHPGDVLGVIHNTACLDRPSGQPGQAVHYQKPRIIDRFYGNRLERAYADGLIKLFPGVFVRAVRESFSGNREKIPVGHDGRSHA